MGLLHSPLSPTDGLVLCLDSANRRSYPGSGNTWFDLSGNSNNGTLIGGVNYNGFAMNFDGVNDQITQSITGLLRNVFTTNIFSVSLWCLVRSFSNYPVIWSLADYDGVQGRDSGLIEFNNTGSQIYVKSANEAVGISGARTYTLNSPALSDKWCHLVFCKIGTGNNGLFYFNNFLQTSYTGAFSTTAFDSVVQTQRFANYSTGASAALNGQLDDIRIYNRVLSAAEIGVLFNSKRMRFGL